MSTELPHALAAALNRAEFDEQRAVGKVRHCERRLEEALVRAREAVAAATEARGDAAAALGEEPPTAAQLPLGPEALRARLEQLRVSLEDSRAHVNDLVADKERLVAENGALQAELEALRQQVAQGGQTAPEGAPAGPHHPTREERIRGAVATSLEADGPEHRTRTGRPVLARVREISRIDDVSAAERDAAWEATQAAAG